MNFTRWSSEMQHVVAVPYPAQGHISPMLQLCQQLVPLGFTFTFVNTHHVHHRLQDGRPSRSSDGCGLESEAVRTDPDLASGLSGFDACNNYAVLEQEKARFAQSPTHDDTVDGLHAASQNQIEGSQIAIRMAFVEGGLPPEAHAHSATSAQALRAAQGMKEPVERLISSVVKKHRVSFVLTDVLLGWGSAAARKYNLPCVAFWPASASSCATMIYFAELSQQGTCVPFADQSDGDMHVLEDIPGLPPTYVRDLPRVWDKSGSLKHNWLEPFHSARDARFLLFNTFEELEGEVIQALSSRQYPSLAVGPLLPRAYMSEAAQTRVHRAVQEAPAMRASLFKEDRTCLDWLDKQASSSVLYVSFGSISVRSSKQLEELAYALKACGCPYLWACKPETAAGGSRDRPEIDREGGRGMITAWAPQLDVLSHPAVGGFVTHCGWNSVMEGAAMGVPMLCWADTGERMVNQRLVVQKWKCGLDMVPDGRRYKQHIDEAVLLTRDEIGMSIRRLMVEDAGASVRAQAAHLRDAAVVAFERSSSKLVFFSQVMQEHALNKRFQGYKL